MQVVFPAGARGNSGGQARACWLPLVPKHTRGGDGRGLLRRDGSRGIQVTIRRVILIQDKEYFGFRRA